MNGVLIDSCTLLDLFTKVIRMLRIFPHIATNPKLSIQVQERIMLAVTSVNECRYCSFFHSKLAIEHGCVDEEINAILRQDFNCVDSEELPALSFAQHFADSHENPSKKALKTLVQKYGRHRASQIIASCVMITIGNLFGNTLDAYQFRLAGGDVKEGSKGLEAIIYYLSIRSMTTFMKKA